MPKLCLKIGLSIINCLDSTAVREVGAEVIGVVGQPFILAAIAKHREENMR